MTIEICLLVWNILLKGNILLIGNILFIGNTLLIRYILLLSSINFGTEISKRLLLRGPDGHWGSRHYTVRLFILCGYIFSEYVMKRKNSIYQPDATSVTFLLIMQGFWAHTYYDVLKTLQDSKTALISQFWSQLTGTVMESVMRVGYGISLCGVGYGVNMVSIGQS